MKRGWLCTHWQRGFMTASKRRQQIAAGKAQPVQQRRHPPSLRAELRRGNPIIGWGCEREGGRTSSSESVQQRRHRAAE